MKILMIFVLPKSKGVHNTLLQIPLFVVYAEMELQVPMFPNVPANLLKNFSLPVVDIFAQTKFNSVENI